MTDVESLKEAERLAYITGDVEKAKLLADLIDTLEAGNSRRNQYFYFDDEDCDS